MQISNSRTAEYTGFHPDTIIIFQTNDSRNELNLNYKRKKWNKRKRKLLIRRWTMKGRGEKREREGRTIRTSMKRREEEDMSRFHDNNCPTTFIDCNVLSGQLLARSIDNNQSSSM
ncbi:hypothetical protein QQG55_11200 [Brugia pahangi]